MNRIFTRRHRTVLAMFSACLLGIAALACWSVFSTRPPEGVEKARELFPGYAVVFNGTTNTMKRCLGPRSFCRQHPMMDYLLVFAPYLERYGHPKEHPIIVRETDDRVIVELPSRFRFPPYNLTIYWGSPYHLKVEIDKKTKVVVSELQG